MRIFPSRIAPRRAAFTLIEMLVVIAIIGIIASMVLGLGSLASRKKHDAVASAIINRLTLIIENYQSKLGYYPPDNFGNRFSRGGSPAYETSTAKNQLLYELTGAAQLYTNGGNFFQGFDGTVLTTPVLTSTFGRGGIANSNPDEPHNFYNPLPKTNDYNFLTGLALSGLTVPLPTPGNTAQPNYVHYDSSSTNRHNPGSFDVWVEYDGGSSAGNTITNVLGNWHQ